MGGTDLRDDELIATLTALGAYYTARADTRRAAQLAGLLHEGLPEGRQWFRPALEMASGMTALLTGDIDSAHCHRGVRRRGRRL